MMKRWIWMAVAMVLFGTTAIVTAAGEVAYVSGTTIEDGSLAPGVSYLQQNGTSYTDANTAGNQHISVVTADQNAGMLVPWSQLSTTGIVGGTVLDIAADFMQWNPGYRVVAAINGDYYNMTSMEPVNALAQFGRVIKPDNFYLDRYFSLGLDDNAWLANKTNETSEDTLLTLYDANGRPFWELAIEGWNRMPSASGVTVYYNLINPPVTTGAHLFKGDVVHQSNYVQRYIRTSNLTAVDTVSMVAHDITVAVLDDELRALLEIADHVEIQTPFGGLYEGMDNVLGVGSQPLVDGSIQAFEDINDQSVSFAQARHPRTSLGFTADGNILFVTADGRQPGMDGVNLRELAAVMRHFGAIDAFNLDGGGSTQLAIDDGSGLRMLNSPSDASLRRVANALLFVVPDVHVDLDIHSRTASDVTFSYEITSDTTIQDVTVYLDDTPYDLEAGVAHTISDLDGMSYHRLTVEVTYDQNGTSQTRTFATERLFPLSDATNPPSDPVAPQNFQVTFEEDSSIDGFIATITFDDPDNRFVKMYLIHDEQRQIASKIIGGYAVDVPDATEGTTYLFTLEVHYRFGGVTPEVVVLDEVFEYTYGNPMEEPSQEDTPPSTTSWIPVVTLSAGGAALIGAGIVWLRRRSGCR